MRRLRKRYGAGVVTTLACYRGFYAVRLSHCKADDPWLYGWCVRSLQGFVR
jgi:hypothetical protein